MLTDDEQARAVAGGAGRGRRAAHRRAPAPTTPATPCELTAQAADHGIDGVLVVTPYYNRPSQAGLEAHFRAVAGATDLPVLLYDIPIRTGRKISHEVLVRLADEVPNIVGLKDAAGQPRRDGPRSWPTRRPTSRSTAATTRWTLPMLAVGAVGVISASPPTGPRPR